MIHLIKPNYKCTDEVVPEGEVLLVQKDSQQTDEDFEAECSTYGGEYNKDTGCRMRKELIEGTSCQYIHGRETFKKTANIAKTEKDCTLLGMGRWDAESNSCMAEVCVALDQPCAEDTTQASGDTTQASGDTTQASGDTTQASGDTTQDTSKEVSTTDTAEEMEPQMIFVIVASAALGVIVLLGMLYSMFKGKSKKKGNRQLEAAARNAKAAYENLEIAVNQTPEN